MYLVDLDMSIYRYLARNYMNWDCGVKGCSALPVSFLDCGNWAGKECGRLAHIYPILLEGKASRPPSFTHESRTNLFVPSKWFDTRYAGVVLID